MSAEVFVFQECRVRLTESMADEAWDGYYYARPGGLPASSPTAWGKTQVGSGSAGLEHGLYAIDTRGSGANALYHTRSSSFVNADGYAIEARMAARARQSGPVRGLFFRDDVWMEYIYFGDGLCGLWYKGASVNLADADKLHLYRIEVLGAAVRLYIDNRLALATTLSQAANGGIICAFGDTATGDNALVDTDFARYKRGAAPYPEALDLTAALVRNALVVRRPRSALLAPRFAQRRIETRVRSWEQTVTLSGDMLRFSDFKDLAPNRDYRLEISGLNPSAGQRESLVCERCRVAENRWGMADNGNLGHGITFAVDGRIY